MARIPYQPADVSEPKALVDAIRARRGGELLNLDRMLLQSAPLARGWNAFLGEVRTNLALSPKLREIAMCVVAVMNDAAYELHQHAPELLRAGGTNEQLEALRDPDAARTNADLFDASERATLALTIAMTRHVRVDASVLDEVRAALHDDRQVVELVGVVAAYNMVSRFLVALEIDPE